MNTKIIASIIMLLLTVGVIQSGGVSNFYVTPTSVNCDMDAYVALSALNADNVVVQVNGHELGMKNVGGSDYEAIVPYEFFKQGEENTVVVTAYQGGVGISMSKKVGVNPCPGVSLPPQDWIDDPIRYVPLPIVPNPGRERSMLPYLIAGIVIMGIVAVGYVNRGSIRRLRRGKKK